MEARAAARTTAATAVERAMDVEAELHRRE